MLRSLATVVAVLALPAPAFAQAATDWAVVECTFSAGGRDTYRVKPGQWQHWNVQSWTWVDRPCLDNSRAAAPWPNGVVVNCSVTVNDTVYQWTRTENSNYYLANGQWYSGAYETESLIVDRRTGALSYSLASRLTNSKLEADTSRSKSVSGTCKRAPDPSLSPKPRPIL